MPAARKYKEMPQEAREQLNLVERIKAHYEDSYDLTDEDQDELTEIDMVFKIIHGDVDINDAREKLKRVFPKKNIYGINERIRQAQAVYADFFTISKEVMRVIQEKRHTRTYHAAMRHGEIGAANRALTSIDKLHDLYTPVKGSAIMNKKLPRTRRTNNPDALKKITTPDE